MLRAGAFVLPTHHARMWDPKYEQLCKNEVQNYNYVQACAALRRSEVVVIIVPRTGAGALAA
jgi:hypothetical protein